VLRFINDQPPASLDVFPLRADLAVGGSGGIDGVSFDALVVCGICGVCLFALLFFVYLLSLCVCTAVFVAPFLSPTPSNG
jgi:hypothetical protein